MDKTLLIIGFVWPEPNTTAAGTRMLQLIQVFKEKSYQIMFVCTTSKSENSLDLEELGVETFDIKLNDSSFDDFIKELNPSIVLFDRFLTEEQFGWRVAESCPNALRILDTEDLHFLRHARQQAFKNNEKMSFSYLVNDLSKREIASIYRCDLSLIISEFEIKLLVDTFKIENTMLLYIPFLLDNLSENKIETYPNFTERQHFMTMGNLKHQPNWQSVLNLKNNIWPKIRKKIPQAELHIYGAYGGQKLMQLNNKKEGFIVKGWVNDVAKTFKQYRVCLAPIQFGAGLKGKLIDAMLFGTPSVTTNIGAEAMFGNLPWNGFIEDDEDLFVEKAIVLYLDEQVWPACQKNGVKIINQRYDKAKFMDVFMQKINFIEENLENHRQQNFIGSLLQHHSMKSTKYMSKWIEAKNK